MFVQTILIMLAASLAARPAEDTLTVISGINGADMTLYALYRDYAGNDRDKSMEYAELFLSRIDTSSMSPYLAPLYTDLSDWYENDRYKFSTAIHYRTSALDIYGKAGDRYREAQSRYILARLYLKTGQYHKTLRYVTEATEYFEKYGYTVEMMECYELLGIVYETCRDYSKSDEYFQAYATAARELRDSTRILIGLNNSAVFASLTGDTTKTIKLLTESISLSRRTRDSALLCNLYINTAAAYAQAGRYGQAEKYLDSSRILLDGIDMYGQYWLQYGDLYMKTGDNTRAVQAFENAASYYSQGEFDQTLKSIYASLNDIYRSMGDTARAYHYLQNMYDIEQNLDREDMILELFKAQNEIEMSREQEAMKISRSRQQILILSVLFVIILVSLAVAFVLRRRAFDIRQKEMQVERDREISEIKKNQQFRTDKILRNAIDRLHTLSEESRSTALRSRINSICDDLRASKDVDAWKEIEQYIPDANSTFFRNLTAAYPNLTVNESRLCVFLNRNLSTKQISEITRQSPESINVARTRLRKKLGITGSDTSMQEFLRKYN